MRRTAPGPGLGVIPSLSELRRDPLGLLTRYHARYGAVVRLGGGAFTVHLVADPELADQVLRVRHANYDRQTRSAEAVRLVTGDSLLTNDGEAWRRHRLTLQPSFTHEALVPLTSAIAAATAAMVERWRALPEKTVVDLAAEMGRLAATIVAKAFFGTDLEEDGAAIQRLLPLILEETYARATAVIPLHRYLRRARDRRFERARTTLTAIVAEIAARAPETALFRRMAALLQPDEMRNETLALLLAGHETTANALAWTLLLLLQHPEQAERVRAEVAAVTADALPSAADLPRLVATTAAIDEAIRLYPPIWIVERRALEDDELGGYAIPAGSIVYVSPYMLHRLPDRWRDPERYDPSRFLGGERHAAYIPFGLGPHRCIGAQFAMLEAKTIVATLLQRCTLVPAPGTDAVRPQAWITLRPRGGVPAFVRPASW